MSLTSTFFTVAEDSVYDHRFWVVDETGEQWIMGPGLDSACLGAAHLAAKAQDDGAPVVSPLKVAQPRIARPRPLATLVGAQVRVYRNLTLNTWSVQYREAHIRPDNGRVSYRWQVAGHDRAVCLRDVHFQVSDAGRQRVLATGNKQVHAYAIGKLATYGAASTVQDGGLFYRLAGECKRPITYNPRTASGPHFSLRSNGEAIFQAKLAFLDASGKVWVDAKLS